MNSLRNVELTKVFFVDIETAPCADCLDHIPAERQALWHKHCGSRHKHELAEGRTHAELFEKASLYAEFGKIVCISVGYFRQLPDDTLEFRIKSFASDDECEVLSGFANLLGNRAPASAERYPKLPNASADGWYLCAHNGREFDYAYLGRRMLICGQHIPPMLDVAGYKPWDLPHLLDTMDMWKFGDNKGHTSLALLAEVFGIPSPKDDIDGSQVGHVYWVEKDLPRIVTYCEKDIITTARVFLHFRGTKDLWAITKVVPASKPAALAAA